MIINPTPQTPGVFNNMWVANMILQQPDPDFPAPLFQQGYGRLNATLLPYDGTHLLATGRKVVFISKLTDKMTEDTVFAGVITALLAEAQRQAKVTTAVKSVSLSAPDPTKPVVVSAKFVDGTTYAIPDCWALAGTDSVFAGVFNNTEVEIARLAGLTVA